MSLFDSTSLFILKEKSFIELKENILIELYFPK